MSFENLGLIEPILKALQNEGYSKPTPIQAKAIPVVLQGRDLLGCAQTGTGKTAAFAIPMIQLMQESKPKVQGKRPIRAMVLTPTRELAIQIEESFKAYGKFTPLKYAVIFGGVSQHPQVEALKSGIDILVATPGRLLDLMDQGYVHLRDIEFFVLDEADRMLDMGFIHDVKKVISRLPQKRQSLFFSATMPPPIAELAKTILTEPIKVEVAPVSSTADTIDQVVYFVDKGNKRNLLLHILKNPEIERALVFTRTKHGADRVAKDLAKSNVKAQAIHGNKSQNARQAALAGFKNKTLRVLVATDIAARGIDIDELSHVINYELPNIPESYVHRIGRTGRAGASGRAIAFCDAEEKAYLKDIEKLIGKRVPVIEEHPFPLVDHFPVKAEKQEGNRRAAQPRSQSQRGAQQTRTSEGRKESAPQGRGPSAEKKGSGSTAPKPQGQQQRSAPSGQGAEASTQRKRKRNRPKRNNAGEAMESRFSASPAKPEAAKQASVKPASPKTPATAEAPKKKKWWPFG